MKLAGGINGWSPTGSVDGHFDRISMQVDPMFGTEDQFRALCAVAGEYDGTVIDDIVPGHTGKGADFRLAEMAYQDYPGIYHMVSIDPQDWHLLPDVPDGRDYANLDVESEAKLQAAGYIIGKLQRVIFYEPGVKETNWSATRVVKGVDGVERRWVYLHYFKAGPALDQLAGPVVRRDAPGHRRRTALARGPGVRRAAARRQRVPRASRRAPRTGRRWSEGHPLSEAANQLISSMVRKMGGFSFQELNLTMDDIKTMGESGADLSYDFVNRPAYHHALAMGDTEFLRLTMNQALALGIDSASLVHALQNHDELTHELVHFATRHRDDVFSYGGQEVTGGELAIRVRGELTAALTGPAISYNRPFTTNGIACTTASAISAILRIPDPDAMSDEDLEQVKRIHLLLAMYNAFQPGVFALSGWDLMGMLTTDPTEVADLIADGDTRWLNRGAHDLMGTNPNAQQSEGGLPRARSLYGTLPGQLVDRSSFARRLRRIIRIRRRYRIPTATQIDVPGVSHRSLLVMVHRLENANLQVTVLNFGPESVVGTIRSEHLPPTAKVLDLFRAQQIAVVDDLCSFSLELDAYQAVPLLLPLPAEEPAVAQPPLLRS